MKTPDPRALALSLLLPAATLFAADPAPARPAPVPAAAAAPLVLPDPVAVVNGQEIKKAEVEAALSDMLAPRKMKAADLPEEQRAMGYRMIVEDMIVKKLLLKEAAGLTVAEADVTARLDKIKSSFGSPEALKKELEGAGQTLEKVTAGVRERLRLEQWMEAQIKDKGVATDADAEAFYKQNPDQFKAPEQVRASHILVKVDQDAKPEVVVEKEKAAQSIADRVKKGEAFDKLAKEISEDPSAKENSGDLNFFGREQMVKPFSDAAFGMKKGEISAPVRSTFGYHVIKVTDRKDAETVTLEKVKPELVAFLTQQKKSAEVEKVVQELRKKAEVKVNLPPAPSPSPFPAGPPAP